MNKTLGNWTLRVEMFQLTNRKLSLVCRSARRRGAMWMLVCCLRFVWLVALFYSRVVFVNSHCKNASAQLCCHGWFLMNLKGNANYFKESQMFCHWQFVDSVNSYTQILSKCWSILKYKLFSFLILLSFEMMNNN